MIHASRPPASILDDILISARRNNQHDGITRALICRADLLARLLKGPCSALTRTFSRILGDNRPLEAALIRAGDIAARDFGARRHAGRSAAPLDVAPAEVRAGAVRRATAAEIRGRSPLATEPA